MANTINEEDMQSHFTYAERVRRENLRARLAGLVPTLTLGDYRIHVAESPLEGGSVKTTVEGRLRWDVDLPTIELLRGLVLFVTGVVDQQNGVRIVRIHIQLLFAKGNKTHILVFIARTHFSEIRGDRPFHPDHSTCRSRALAPT